jgi:Flp pilus assembly protein TadG
MITVLRLLDRFRSHQRGPLPGPTAIGTKITLRAWLYRFNRDRKANVAVITALTMVPIIFLLGMTIDYTQALRKKEQLDAAADAAAIAAVRPAMLMQTDSVAKATATAIFMSTANSIAPGTRSRRQRSPSPMWDLSAPSRFRIMPDPSIIFPRCS